MFDKKLIHNYFYNSGLNILNMLFPIISFPYISRVLGVEGLGEASFILVFSGYFITISALGIPIYGIREISIAKSSENNLNKIFSELFIINFISTIFFSLIYIILIFNIPQLNANVWLYLLIGINVIFSFFQIDWLFQGLENYKIITIRSFIAKLLAFILMILFVNNEGDIDIYLMTNIVALTGANFFNILYSRKYISLKFSNLEFAHHFKPIGYFLSTRIMSTVYTVLDILILGFLVGNYYVGLYIAAIRLNRAVVSIVTSLSAVLLPRSAEYLNNNQHDEYMKITEKSFYFILLLSTSIASFLFLFSDNIIILFAGEKFIDSIITMQILTVIIITVALSNFTGVQVLYAHKKEKIVLNSLAIGAITNFILNFMLIPLYKHNGAAIATVIAEIAILFYQTYEIKKIIKFNLNLNRILNICYGIVIILVVMYLLNLFIKDFSIYLRLIIGVPFFIIVYFSVFFILKESIILKVISKIIGSKNEDIN